MPNDPKKPAGPDGFAPELVFHLRSLSRLIYVVTQEEDVFLKKFRNLVKKFSAQTHVYNMTFGMVPLDLLLRDWTNRAHQGNPNLTNIHDALDEIYKADPKDQQNFYIITDPEIHLSDPMVQRRLLDILHQLHNDEHNVKLLIFLSNRKYIPPKLSRYIQVVEDKGLAGEDIAKTLDRPCKALKIPIPEDHVELFRGMTSFEIEAAVSQSVVMTMEDPSLPQDEIVPAHIHAFRRQQLKKTGLIEYIDTSAFTQKDVGGTERFKAWASETKAAFTDEGRAYGLKIPKGVLLVGVWGTGKSLSAKTLGSEWGLPVVLLEMGKLRSSGVGDTEANIYSVLKMVEGVAPCILWIDEAEKSLSGGQSSAVSDSGTTARTLGIFSTWIQETNLPISLVLTANRLSTLPVEFVNRMNERWFFDLPSHDERIEILKIHLRKNGQDTDNYKLAALAEAAKGMVGREIEQCIEAALMKSFHEHFPHLDQGILETVLKRKPRIVKTMTDEVKEITDWVGFDAESDDGIKAHFASKPDRTDGKFRGGAFEIVQGGLAPKG
jgi:SpoVK/Ycf46/Vps4 family AAA+-type ATPase